jgi:hypothetical protein
VDSKELTKLVKTLRKLGVSVYKTPEIELSLSSLPEKRTRQAKSDTKDPIIEGQFSDEQALFWSSAQLPMQEQN